jgi:uncharacterized protein
MKDIVRESYLSAIRPFYDSDYIKAITGIRRSGKSVILKQIIQELKGKGTPSDHILCYDLEGESGEGVTTRKKLEKRLHNDIKDNSLYYIFIDEVQHIKKFEVAIASARVSYHCSLFVTGSNSKLLHGKLQDRLTGRAKEFVVYPFSYSESLEFKKINNLPIGANDFADYLKWGGLPQRYLEIDEQGIRKYHESLVHSIVEKDVFGNHKKLSRDEFERVANYVLANSGKSYSAPSLTKYLFGSLKGKEAEAKRRTIANYAKYLGECFLTIPCKSYDLKGKRALKGEQKYYCSSSGIRTAYTNTVDTDPSFALEGIVFLELLKRGYDVYTGQFRNGEIDFVAIKNGMRRLIQVAYLLPTQKTVDREFAPFKKIDDRSPAYVMSLDGIDFSNDLIKHLNIVDWLTGKVEF